MGEFFRRIRYLINRRRFDAELESDMEFHREMAARAGRSNFGNTLRMREQSREAWGWTWLDRLVQDLHLCCEEASALAGFHADRDANAGLWHWSDDGDFLDCGRRAAQAAAVCRSRQAGGAWRHNRRIPMGWRSAGNGARDSGL